MTIRQLEQLVQQDIQAANHLIQTILDSIDPSTKRDTTCLLPLITLLSCHACNYQGEYHIKIAALSEILFLSRSLHKNIGNDSTTDFDKKNILIGDCLHTQYLKLMLEIGNTRIIEFMANITCTITYGDIKHLHDTSSEETTMSQIKNTALLYGAAAALGGYLSQESEQIVTALYEYGIHLGHILQFKQQETIPEKAHNETQLALQCLDNLPESIYKEALKQLVLVGL